MPLTFAQDTSLTGGRGTPNAISPGSDGYDWTQISGTQSLAFTSNQIVASYTGASDPLVVTYSGLSETDQEVLVNGTQTITDPQSIGAVLRCADSNNYYYAHIVSDDIFVEKTVSGVTTSLGTASKSFPFGTKFSIRFQCIGSTLNVRAWDASTNEPAAWDISVTDTSLGSGKFGIFSAAIGTGDVKFDSFVASNGLIQPSGGGLSAGSLNSDLVPSTDISAYKRWSLQIATVASGGTITFYGSNDGLNFTPIFVYKASDGSIVATSSATGIFYADRICRYILARQTAWSSGATTGVIELYT